MHQLFHNTTSEEPAKLKATKLSLHNVVWFLPRPRRLRVKSLKMKNQLRRMGKRQRKFDHCRLVPIGRVVHADLLRNLGLRLQERYRQGLELSRVRPSCQERKIQKIILTVACEVLGLIWSPRINRFHRRRKKALFPCEKPPLHPGLVTSRFSFFLLVPSKLVHRLRLMTFFVLPLKRSKCQKIHWDCGKFVISLFWREGVGTISLFL